MRYIVSLALLALTPALATAQITPPDADAGAVIVLQRVNSRYDQPGNITQALDKAIPAQVTVRPAEGVTNILSRLYAVGDHNVKPAVRPLIDWIRAHNRLDDDFALAAGQLLTVPDVPKLGLTVPSAGNTNNRVAKLSLDLRPLNSLTGLLQLDGERSLDEAQRRGAAFVVSIRQLTAEQAARALERDPQLTLVSAPLTLKFLDQPGVAAAPVAGPDVIAIQGAAARPKLQKPVLFVFDASWPSLAEEEISRTYILTALRDLRAKLLIPPIKPFNPACALGSKIGAWAPTAGSHTAEIAEALSGFQAVAPDAVKVVYVPAIAEGPCAGEVIGQIAEFHLIAEHMADALGLEPALPDIVKGYHALAAKVVSRLDVAATDGEATTDVETIQGMLEFARHHGASLKQPVFVSMSWEFPLNRYFPAIPAEFGGLLVVAAGNDGIDDQGNARPPVIQTKVQFAERSFHPGDMLAVMNVDGTGKLACSSSLVDPSGAAFVTGYAGDISQGCGTSFSAPRVAWLLALRESTKAPINDLTDFTRQLRLEFIGGLNVSASTAGVYYLDVTRLFSSPP